MQHAALTLSNKCTAIMLPTMALVPADISPMKGGMSVAVNILGGKKTLQEVRSSLRLV